MTENIEPLLAKAQEMIISYGMQLLYAILVLLIGLRIISFLGKRIKAALVKSKIDDSLVPFLSSLISTILKVCLGLIIMEMLGIEATSFIAILGAAGLAIGMALSGTLSNFAGGVVILILKPYKVGDVIEAQGYVGTVSAIQIFTTILKTPDNKTIFIPNGPLSTGSLINYTLEDTRRVDMTFGIGYGDDIDKAKAILNELIQKDERILKEPAPMVVVGSLGDSSVNFTVRVWTKTTDYWPVFFHMQEIVKKTFDERGISIPFPQRDVHIINSNS